MEKLTEKAWKKSPRTVLDNNGRQSEAKALLSTQRLQRYDANLQPLSYGATRT